MTGENVFFLTTDLRAEYERMFSSCEVREAKRSAIEDAARAIATNAHRYQAISAITGVPWYVIGILHLLESGLSFDRHFHNGDPLFAQTVRVPKHRPPGTPPFTWAASAIDALQYDQLAGWSDWSIAGMLFQLERYNGLGYRLHNPSANSPYLWSCTNQYEKGCFRADGKFDPELVSQQIGAAAILRALVDLELVDITQASGAPDDYSHAGSAAAPPMYPGRAIKKGERNRSIVLLVQRQLDWVSCGPLDVDGQFGPKTESAVKLFQSRSVDSRGNPLEVDGVIGSLTWEALFGKVSIPVVDAGEQDDALVRRALEVAASQVGVMEDPPYSNGGREVRAYLASVGIDVPAPWCAAFLYWCFEQAARELELRNPLVKTASCHDHWHRAPDAGARLITKERATADPSLVSPGQIFIMDHGHGKGHTGIVESVQGGMLVTIEGNTGSDGTREGLGVFRRKQRKISSIELGFIDYATHRVRPTVEPRPTDAKTDLPDVAPLALTRKAGGLLLEAVQQNAFEPPTWVDVDFGELTVQVGAHALRARVGGQLLRLPVCYKDVIAICSALGWVPPTYALSDAIWKAATVRLEPQPSGSFDRATKDQKIRDKKATALEYVVAHNNAIDALIPAGRWGELAADEGKDWVLCNRNRFTHAATTYGWRWTRNGKPIQGRGPDDKPPAHDSAHFDYSQVLRPIKRIARRKSDGAEVDLLEVFVKHGVRMAMLEPFRQGATPASRRGKGPRNKRGGATGAQQEEAPE